MELLFQRRAYLSCAQLDQKLMNTQSYGFNFNQLHKNSSNTNLTDNRYIVAQNLAYSQ